MNRPLLTPEQRQMFASAAAANPGLGLSFGAPPPDGASFTACAADRVLLTGGQISSYVTPQSIVPFEAVYRRLPIDGIFDATPQQPCQFDMGFFQVPPEMALVLLDWNFNIYRPSGSAAGDFVPLEANRLPTQVGWSIKSNANLQGNFHYELNPIPPAEGQPSFQSNPNPGFTTAPGGLGAAATDDQFTAARYQQVQAAVGDLSLMPQRHHREGLVHVPAPWVLHSSQGLTLGCHVFRALQIPIAFFEAEIFGFLLPDSDVLNLQKALAPCLSKPGGI